VSEWTSAGVSEISPAVPAPAQAGGKPGFAGAVGRYRNAIPCNGLGHVNGLRGSGLTVRGRGTGQLDQAFVFEAAGPQEVFQQATNGGRVARRRSEPVPNNTET
jgi:hypothetical protein